MEKEGMTPMCEVTMHLPHWKSPFRRYFHSGDISVGKNKCWTPSQY